MNNIYIIIFFSIIAFVFVLPVFQNFDNWGIEDWDQHLFYHGVPRATMLQYHQFPLWNPYYCGGTVSLANPQSRFLSPTFLLILLFGAVKGIKIEIWLYLVIGMMGTYQLMRYYKSRPWKGRDKLDKSSAIISSFVFMLSSMYALNLTAGMTWFLTVAYLPWVFLFYLKSYSLLSGLFLVLMFFGGGVYVLAITVLFLILYSLIKRKGGKLVGIILIYTLCLGAIKIFPSVEFMYQHPRYTDEYSGFSFNSLGYSLLNPNQRLADIEMIKDASYGMDENGMYIGIIPFILFIIGVVFYFRRRRALVLCMLLFLWISFGNRVTPSLWELLHKFPVFNSMRVAQRFRIIFMLCLSIFAGFGFQTVKDYIKRKTLNQFFTITCIFVILADLIIVNLFVWKDAFPIPPLKTQRSDKFCQVLQLPSYGAFSSLYPGFLCNIGTIDAYETANVPRNAVPIQSDSYKGEVYLHGTEGKAYIKKWSPNKIVIGVNATDDGYVVLNQNYYTGWRVKGKNVEAIDKLLAVKVSPHEKEIELYYLPLSFIIGSIVTFITCLIILLRIRR